MLRRIPGNDEPMPVEESGNMLIMTLSYVQKTNDQSLINSYVRSSLRSLSLSLHLCSSCGSTV